MMDTTSIEQPSFLAKNEQSGQVDVQEDTNHLENIVFDTVQFIKTNNSAAAVQRPADLKTEIRHCLTFAFLCAFLFTISLFALSKLITISYLNTLSIALNNNVLLTFTALFTLIVSASFAISLIKNVISPSFLIAKFHEVQLQFNTERFNCTALTSYNALTDHSFNYNEIRSIQLNNHIEAKQNCIRRAKLLKKAKHTNILDSGNLTIHLKNGESLKLLLLDSIFNQHELDDIVIEFKNRGVKVIGFDFSLEQPVSSNLNQTQVDQTSTETVYNSATQAELNQVLARFHNITTVKVKSITFSLLIATVFTFAFSEISQIESLVVHGIHNYNPFDRYSSDVSSLFIFALMSSLVIINIIFFMVRSISRGKFSSRYITFYKDQLSYYLISEHPQEQFGYLNLSQVEAIYFLAPIESSKNFKPLRHRQIKKLGQSFYKGAPGVLCIELKSGEIKKFSHMTMIYSRMKMESILKEFKSRGIKVYDNPSDFAHHKQSAFSPLHRSHHFLNW